MFVVSLTYVQPLSEVEKHLAAHRVFLDRQYAAGRFIVAGRKVPRTGGIILADAPSLDELWEVLRQDPFHREGVARFEVVEFEPTGYVLDFAPLVTSRSPSSSRGT